MYYIRSYKTAQSARVALQYQLNKRGFKLSDVEFEIKRMRGNGRFHPVVHFNSGKHLTRDLAAAGIVVTH